MVQGIYWHISVISHAKPQITSIIQLVHKRINTQKEISIVLVFIDLEGGEREVEKRDREGLKWKFIVSN